jgi:guanylate kinase
MPPDGQRRDGARDSTPAMAEQQSKTINDKPKSRPGPLIIVSGPSGCGKSTVIAKVRKTARVPLRVSVSATTRAPRAGEKDATDYHFWTEDFFKEQIRANSFLEWACVHGCYYGTLKSEVIPYREKGIGVILDIDVQGATEIRRIFPDSVSVFMRTRSMETYEERLRSRGTENEESLRRRLAAAQGELNHAGEYNVQVVNEDLDTAVKELREFVESRFEGS